MELKGFFERYPKVALAFSGGVDSAYLLYAAKKYGADVKAFFVKSQFQPEFELRDAEELAHSLNADMEIIYCDVLADAVVADNPENRCYYCKHRIFDMLRKAAGAAGYTCIIDGTNASDLVADRPGMKALAEMEVLSPLRLCGLTKEEIRSRSKEAGLFTWNKPSYACLATRVPAGEKITREKLQRVEARIQLREDQMEKAVELCGAVCQRLKPYFEIVLLDLEGR